MNSGKAWATWLFLALATLVNMALILGFSLTLLVLSGLLPLPRDGWWDILWFGLSLLFGATAAFFVYRGLLGWLRSRTSLGRWVDERVLKGTWV